MNFADHENAERILNDGWELFQPNACAGCIRAGCGDGGFVSQFAVAEFWQSFRKAITRGI
jgi:hypothetical protein